MFPATGAKYDFDMTAAFESSPINSRTKRIRILETRTTGLEPATSGVTGRCSNQLSYVPYWRSGLFMIGLPVFLVHFLTLFPPRWFSARLRLALAWHHSVLISCNGPKWRSRGRSEER